ncbi:hypothetical protein MASR2M41_22200 [Flammeovirgaceae bacterium]
MGESNAVRYLPTWNVSGAWNIDNESFFENTPGLNVFNSLKLRTTYGISGNLPPNASALLNLQADATIRPTDVEPVLRIKDLTNSELTWEKLKEFNVGLDFGLKKFNVSGSFDYYVRNALDLIGIVQTSGIGGQGLKVGNFADMEAQGFEISLSTVNLNRPGFTWKTDFNFGYTKDKITRLDYGPRLVDAISQNGAAVLGGPRRGVYSTKFAGLSEKGLPQFYDDKGEIASEFDLQSRKDLGTLLTYGGPIEPRGAGGLTNSFTYKNFALSFLLSFKYDYKIRLNDSFFATYNDTDALPGDLVNRWAVPGDEMRTNIPVILDKGISQVDTYAVLSYDLYNKSNIRVANGDYIRLKSARLSYQLPGNVTNRIGLANANISLEGQNIALLYSDKALNGQDPEFFSSGGVALPQPKIITFSLNIGL